MNGCKLVHESYTWEKRMNELKKIIKKNGLVK